MSPQSPDPTTEPARTGPSSWLRTLSHAGGWLVLGLFAVIITVLCVVGIMFTSQVSQNAREIVSFSRDNPVIRVAMVVAVLLGVGVLHRWKPIQRWDTNRLLVGACSLMMMVSLAAILLARNVPGADASALCNSATALVQGKSEILLGRYFTWYPFQVSSTAYIEQVFWVFGPLNLNALRIINVVAVAWIAVSLTEISRRIFHHRGVTNVTVLLTATCLPLLFFPVFVYPVIISCAFVTAAVAALCRYFDGERWWNALLSVSLFAAATILKGNSIIVVLAALVATVLFALARRRWGALLVVVLLAATLVVPTALVKRHYEQRAGGPIGPGIPMLAGVAMGMQEGPLGAGWWNGNHARMFEDNHRDPVKTSQAAQKYLDERFAYFASHPVEAIGFFNRKIGSQWINPEMESVWIASSQSVDRPRSEWGRSLYADGPLFRRAFSWMNSWQSFLYIGAALAAVVLRRLRRREGALLLMLAFIGGVAFHAGFEAKAQHALQYTLLVIPLAAGGLWYAMLTVSSWTRRAITIIKRRRAAAQS